MKNLLMVICALFLLIGCTTTEVDSVAKSQSEKPASIRVGMSESEVLSILGSPRNKSFVTLDNGGVIEIWFYRHLVREWKDMQDTDFETETKVNLVTGESEEVVVPIESTVTRSLYQEITIKLKNSRVIELATEMDEDLDEVMN